MKPPYFNYVRAKSVDDAVAALVSGRGDAKLIAGGQSLVPMLNFRLLDANTFVDINDIEELRGIEKRDGGGLLIGALTRHYDIETSAAVHDQFPILNVAMTHVAHLAIRNRGTLGGSLSHADPAAELPALSLLLGARILTSSPTGGRSIETSDFFVGPLETILEFNEIITSVEWPALPPGAGWGFEEFSQRSGDFAIAGAAAIIETKDGKVFRSRIVLFGVHDTPTRVFSAEAALITDGPAGAAAAAKASISPINDLKASADYRKHLAGVLVERVVSQALERAGA